MADIWGFSKTTADRLAAFANTPKEISKARTQLNRQPRVIGGELRFFKLREDVIGSGRVTVWAQNSDDTGASLGGHTEVVSWLGIINGAKAGYVGMFSLIDGNWEFVQGNCVVPCVPTGSITVGSPPGGTVDEAYAGHTVTETDTNSDLAISGLPPGLSETGGVISGTPTSAGTYYAIATATSPKTGDEENDCTITKIVKIVIAPAEEE